MKLPNHDERDARPRQHVDWVRATYLTAVGGAVFWALAVHVALKHGGSAALLVSMIAAASALVIAGIVMRRRAKISLLQSISVALIVAPVTGLIPLIPLGIIELVRRIA